jgi:hypothetical protein
MRGIFNGFKTQRAVFLRKWELPRNTVIANYGQDNQRNLNFNQYRCTT